MMHTCSHKNCTAEGTFAAPKDARNLGARQYFCQEHIIAFNKRWDGLKGFDAEEVFSMQMGGATWNRPTWHMASQKAKQAAMPQFNTAEDLLKFFNQRRVSEGFVQQESLEMSALPADVQASLKLMKLDDMPKDESLLKKRYLSVVKAIHPDKQPDEKKVKATKVLQKVNVAYQILQDFSAKQMLGERVRKYASAILACFTVW